MLKTAVCRDCCLKREPLRLLRDDEGLNGRVSLMHVTELIKGSDGVASLTCFSSPCPR